MKQDKEILVKVKDVEQAITEFTFLLENVKSILAELENKKDIIANIEKIDDLQEQIQQFKNIAVKMKEMKSDIEFVFAAANTTADIIKQATTELKNTYIYIKQEIQEQAEKANETIANSYKKVIKKINNNLLSDVENLLERINVINNEIEQVYEQDYYKNVTKLKNKINFSIFVIILLVIFNAFAICNINKKLSNIQKVNYYNYSVLHKIVNSE